MKKVFIIHGFNGTPNGGWRSWLMGELAAMDVYACALPMPSPQAPVLEDWIAELGRVLEREDPTETILVGHSLGVPTILRRLQRAPEGFRIAGAVLVSGPIATIDANHAVDPFLREPFDLESIRRRIARAAVIHGDDDDRVPLAHGERLAAALSAPLVVVPGGGHLNGKSGWRTLPQALEAIEGMLAA